MPGPDPGLPGRPKPAWIQITLGILQRDFVFELRDTTGLVRASPLVQGPWNHLRGFVEIAPDTLQSPRAHG